ncbi:unnamed protein product [Phytophthora fragariaefolia]|uniref:RxLR effector protein n=1 Tax=Phytophthora fragariaefolia TaxID=1490495 RepID=A0A9W6XP61_9STRA|nr:unnamed protein product [Phytophthora fragariaefolia]
MRRIFAVLLLALALLEAASEAFVPTTDLEQDKKLAITRNTGPKRLLRAVNTDEERGVLGAKTLENLSDLAEKAGMLNLSKNLLHKSWLMKGETPQTKFKEYKWNGLSYGEIMQHPMYPRYKGFDDVWQKAQYKKGTLLTIDKWKKLMKEQEKQKPQTTR